MTWNWCPIWICKIICFFIGHKWTDWWNILDEPLCITGKIRWCERCTHYEEITYGL